MDIAGKFSNTNGLVDLLLIVIAGVLLYLFIRAGLKYTASGDRAGSNTVERNRFFLTGLILVLFVFFSYFLFGAGDAQRDMPVEETGEYQHMEKSDDESSLEEIQKDAEESRQIELQIQHNDSLRKEEIKKSEEETDRVLNEILEK